MPFAAGETVFFRFSGSDDTCVIVPLDLNQKKGMPLMIARFNPRTEDLQRLQVGPIAPHLSGSGSLQAFFWAFSKNRSFFAAHFSHPPNRPRAGRYRLEPCFEIVPKRLFGTL